MEYDTQNYRGFGHRPLSCILKNRMFLKVDLDLFPSSGEGRREAPTRLERANLNHWTRLGGR